MQNAACETPDLCQLKQLCVAAYAAYLHALSETARAKSLLAVPGSETQAAQALETASHELSRSAPQIAQCADSQGAAQRTYKP